MKIPVPTDPSETASHQTQEQDQTFPDCVYLGVYILRDSVQILFEGWRGGDGMW